jgi:heme exporter protein D
MLVWVCVCVCLYVVVVAVVVVVANEKQLHQMLEIIQREKKVTTKHVHHHTYMESNKS